MYNDAIDLAAFYNTALGHTARRLIRRKVRSMWPNLSGLVIMGMGYATPYLRPFMSEADRVFAVMPAQQGATYWPAGGLNLTVLCDDGELPLQDSSVDRIIMVHCVECTERLRPMLHEAWRVLAGDGRLLVIEPNRRGLWARFERTPFGHGQPYSISQLSRLLRDNMFTAINIERALYIPPYPRRIIIRSATGIEDIGSRWLKRLGGVVVFEAAKQIYAASKVRSAESRGRKLMPVSVARVTNIERF